MRLFAAAALAALVSPVLASPVLASPGLAPAAPVASAPVAAALAAPPTAPLAAPAAGSVRIAMRRETLPPGGRLREHRTSGERYVMVVSGRLKVSDLVTGEEQVVEPGKMAAERPGDWHVAEALGAAPVVLYLIDRTPAVAEVGGD